MSKSLAQAKQLIKQNQKGEAMHIIENMSPDELSNNVKVVQNQLIQKLEQLNELNNNNNPAKDSNNNIFAFMKNLQVQLQDNDIVQLILEQIQEMIFSHEYKPDANNVVKQILALQNSQLTQKQENQHTQNRINELEVLNEMYKEQLEERKKDMEEMTKTIIQLRKELDLKGSQSEDSTSKNAGTNYIEIIKQLNEALRLKQDEMQSLIDELNDLKSRQGSGNQPHSENDDILQENQKLKENIQLMEKQFQIRVDEQVNQAYTEMENYFQQFVQAIDDEKNGIYNQVDIVRDEINKVIQLNVQFNQIEMMLKQLAAQHVSQDNQQEANDNQQIIAQYEQKLQELRQSDHDYIEKIKKEHKHEVAQLNEQLKYLQNELKEYQSMTMSRQATTELDQQENIVSKDKQIQRQQDADEHGIQCKNEFYAIKDMLTGTINEINNNKSGFKLAFGQLWNTIQQLVYQSQKNKNCNQNQSQQDIPLNSNQSNSLILPNVFLDQEILFKSRFSIVQQFKSLKLLHIDILEDIFKAYDVILELFQSEAMYQNFKLDGSQDLIFYIRENYNYSMDYYCNEQLIKLFKAKLIKCFVTYHEKYFNVFLALCQILMLMILDGYEARDTHVTSQIQKTRFVVFPSFQHIVSKDILNALMLDLDDLNYM